MSREQRPSTRPAIEPFERESGEGGTVFLVAISFLTESYCISHLRDARGGGGG
jgi:hypothetical protein